MDWDGLVSQTTRFYSLKILKKSGHVIFYSRHTCSSDEIVAFICCTAVTLYILILDKLAFNRWRILYDDILTHTVMPAFYEITRNMLPIVDRVERCVYCESFLDEDEVRTPKYGKCIWTLYAQYVRYRSLGTPFPTSQYISSMQPSWPVTVHWNNSTDGLVRGKLRVAF